MWRSVIAGCLLLSVAHLVSSLGQYSRLVSYENEVVVRCSDKRKGTIQLLQQNTDEWHVGEDTIDLRMPRAIFIAVQEYVPECHIIIEDVEAHVQMAESQMFPARIQEEELWAQKVLESILKTKPTLAECQAAIENWEKARFQETHTWFEKYHEYDEVVRWYSHLATEHSDLVQFVESIGETDGGLAMPAVHITASDDPERHKIYFQCQIHAREWISGAVCMYIVNELVTKYGQTEGQAEEVTSILDRVEFIVVPFVNPDGYVYTWKHDRLWRKNRRIVETQPHTQSHLSSTCIGVDINRNFPEGWEEGSAIECGEDYGGPSAGSEKETQNIMRYWKSKGPIVGAIDWHSYGKLILHPWAWTWDDSKHDGTIVQLGEDMVNAIMKVHGVKYTSEKSIDLYQCYGIATDWFYSDDASSNNGGYRSASYVIELRDDARYGFLLPPDQIIPTGEEVFPAVLVFVQRLLTNPIHYVPKDALIQNTYTYYGRYDSQYNS